MYPVEYVATVWNSDENKEEINHGVTFAGNYTEAMSNIESYYGDELITIKVTMLEESPVYVLEDCLTHSNELRIDGTISEWS